MCRMTKAMALVAVMALSGAATLGAQNPAMPRHQPGAMTGMPDRMDKEMQGMMQDMQETMHQMMGVYAYGPDMLLDRKAGLALTPDQVRKLEALAAEREPAVGTRPDVIENARLKICPKELPVGGPAIRKLGAQRLHDWMR